MHISDRPAEMNSNEQEEVERSQSTNHLVQDATQQSIIISPPSYEDATKSCYDTAPPSYDEIEINVALDTTNSTVTVFDTSS